MATGDRVSGEDEQCHVMNWVPYQHMTALSTVSVPQMSCSLAIAASLPQCVSNSYQFSAIDPNVVGTSAVSGMGVLKTAKL